MTQRLWLIGGTQESRQLVQQLYAVLAASSQIPTLLITVTTAAARSLYPQAPPEQIWVGRLTTDEADRFISDHHITAILDLSHPFAPAISQLAIAIAETYHLPYLRYERPAGEEVTECWRDRRDRLGLIQVPQLHDLLTSAYLTSDRTLLTLGYRQLAEFAPWQSRATLFARILPSPEALNTALQQGFTPDRLIALRPPIGLALETALWQHWHITQVITKASGAPGGQNHKRQLATKLGVRLIEISRPAIAYPHQTDRLDTALHFALRYGS